MYQLLAQSQAQPCALLALPPTARLAKAGEEQRELIFPNANPRIRHGKVQNGVDRGCLGRYLECHLPRAGEFQGVLQQVHQNLGQPPLICHHTARQRGSGRESKRQPLGHRTGVEDSPQMVQQPLQYKRSHLQAHLPRLNFRHIQHFVDKFEQVFPAGLHNAQLLPLFPL